MAKNQSTLLNNVILKDTRLLRLHQWLWVTGAAQQLAVTNNEY